MKGRLLEDKKGCGKKGDWFYIREPEDKDTPKFSRWLGQTISGFVVIFETKLMTPNTCRQLPKSDDIRDIDSGERIYHFWREASDEILEKFNGLKK